MLCCDVVCLFVLGEIILLAAVFFLENGLLGLEGLTIIESYLAFIGGEFTCFDFVFVSLSVDNLQYLIETFFSLPSTSVI